MRQKRAKMGNNCLIHKFERDEQTGIETCGIAVIRDMEYVKDSDEAKQLPDKAVDALNVWFDELKKDK